jgi:hypothetical protein
MTRPRVEKKITLWVVVWLRSSTFESGRADYNGNARRLKDYDAGDPAVRCPRLGVDLGSFSVT